MPDVKEVHTPPCVDRWSLPWLNALGVTVGCARYLYDSDASVPAAGGESSPARRDDVQAEDARGRAGGGECQRTTAGLPLRAGS